MNKSVCVCMCVWGRNRVCMHACCSLILSQFLLSLPPSSSSLTLSHTRTCTLTIKHTTTTTPKGKRIRTNHTQSPVNCEALKKTNIIKLCCVQASSWWLLNPDVSNLLMNMNNYHSTLIPPLHTHIHTHTYTYTSVPSLSPPTYKMFPP